MVRHCVGNMRGLENRNQPRSPFDFTKRFSTNVAIGAQQFTIKSIMAADRNVATLPSASKLRARIFILKIHRLLFDSR
jgi:hypothetical protein